MLRSLHNLKRDGAVFSAFLSLLCINAAFADSSSDRLAAYKANKLIPQDVYIAASNQSDAEVAIDAVFTPIQLTWATADNAKFLNLKAKFSAMSLSELEDFVWLDSMWEPTENAKEMAEYLHAIQTGAIISDINGLTPEKAKELKMEAFKEFYGTLKAVGTIPFAFDGTEDFSGIEISGTHLTQCTGITGAQIASCAKLSNVTLPAIAFTGEEDFNGKTFYGVDFSKCTGLTSNQIASGGDIRYANLPAISFNGTEDFSGKALTGVDFSKCTELTANQFLSGSDLSRVTLPAITFSGLEDFAGKTLSYVDFTRCTGITAEQLLSSQSITYAKLPPLTFSGNEDFTGKKLTGVDLTKCTGFTGKQISSASGWKFIYLTKAQYDTVKEELAASMPTGTTKKVRVDGVTTTISGTGE